MKISVAFFALFLAVASSFAAPRNTPGLPFDAIKIVSPSQLDAQPSPSFMPSPFTLKGEFDKRNLAGEVLLGFTISVKGKPEKIKVLKSNNPEMAKLAAAYVAKCVFRPGRAGGKPVACEAELRFFDVPSA